MRVTQVEQNETDSARLSAVTNARNREIPSETNRNARHDVRNQRPSETVRRASFAGVIHPLNQHLGARLRCADMLWE